MSDALAVIAIYLSLATILMTTCFGRVEAWHARVSSVYDDWLSVKRRNLPENETRSQQRIARSLRRTVPWKSLGFVTFLLLTLAVFAYLIGNEIRNPSFSLLYIWIPGLVAGIVFLASSIVLLWRGTKTIENFERELANPGS